MLIATAFVHLLPTAFISLLDPCLPPFWNDKYPAIAGAIAMAAVFLVTVVEMIFTRGICKGQYNPEAHREAALEAVGDVKVPRISMDKKRNGTADDAELEDAIVDEEYVEDNNPPPSSHSDRSEHIGGLGGMGNTGFGMLGRRRSRSHSVGQSLQRLSQQGRRPTAEVLAVQPSNTNNDNVELCRSRSANIGSGPMNLEKAILHHGAHGAPIPLTPQQVHKKATLQCFLLEMGILFHSVFIGMALSVTVGPPFIVLLIAIIFHQTFEGLALGSRIAVLKWPEGSWQPWIMALAYGLTTPIGQAIGLGTHTLYAPDSQTGLLMVGIMNAISSGLLVFAGLVELLAEDFLSDESWHTLTGSRRIWACICVFAGAFGMSLVGAWA